MIRPRFKFNPQKSYFDRPAVIAAAGVKTARALSKAGSHIRRTARSSIRLAKKPSKPGKPPHGHAQQRLKTGIEFAWDFVKKCVVVGPAALNWIHFTMGGQPIKGIIPEILERGGEYQVLEWFLPSVNKWRRADLRSKRKISQRRTRMRKIKIEARPYMGPAFEANKDVTMGLFVSTPWAVKETRSQAAA